MNILDALLRISECWKITTYEDFDMHELISVDIGVYSTILFGMRDGNTYRIRINSCFVEKYEGRKGYKRI